MNFAPFVATVDAAACCSTDEASFETLFQALADASWSPSLSERHRNLVFRPGDDLLTLRLLQNSLNGRGSNAVSFDNLPLFFLRGLSTSGVVSLLEYMRLLTLFPAAVSNIALQLAIYKKGPKHLFTSYRPIKLGYAVNRLEASCIHHEAAHRAELEGSWDAQCFSYRKEITPFAMAFAIRAAIHIALVRNGEIRIVDRDETSAFDRVICDDLRDLRLLWPTQCAFGKWAFGFYRRQRVRLSTVFGPSPLVSTEEGFSQGCPFAPTGYNLLGAVRSLFSVSSFFSMAIKAWLFRQ